MPDIIPKRYRLLKDLPGVNAGEEYRLDLGGYHYVCVTYAGSPGDMVNLSRETVEASNGFFEEIKEEMRPLYPLLDDTPCFFWNGRDEGEKNGMNRWSSIEHFKQYRSICLLAAKVLQHRLNLLHEQWEPKGAGDIYFIAGQCDPDGISYTFEPQTYNLQSGLNRLITSGFAWKTREQAQAECDLLNAIHSVKL